MPEIEYIKDYTFDGPRRKRTIKKGLRGHVTRKKAAELEKAGIAIVVGSDSNKDTLARTAEINEATKASRTKKKED